MSEERFFGEPGVWEPILQGQWIDHFRNKAPLTDETGPTWLAYRNPSQAGTERAEQLLSKKTDHLLEREGWLLVRRGESRVLVLGGDHPFVAAVHRGPVPEGMSDEDVFSELSRLAEYARTH